MSLPTRTYKRLVCKALHNQLLKRTAEVWPPIGLASTRHAIARVEMLVELRRRAGGEGDEWFPTLLKFCEDRGLANPGTSKG